MRHSPLNCWRCESAAAAANPAPLLQTRTTQPQSRLCNTTTQISIEHVRRNHTSGRCEKRLHATGRTAARQAVRRCALARAEQQAACHGVHAMHRLRLKTDRRTHENEIRQRSSMLQFKQMVPRKRVRRQQRTARATARQQRTPGSPEAQTGPKHDARSAPSTRNGTRSGPEHVPQGCRAESPRQMHRTSPQRQPRPLHRNRRQPDPLHAPMKNRTAISRRAPAVIAANKPRVMRAEQRQLHTHSEPRGSAPTTTMKSVAPAGISSAVKTARTWRRHVEVEKHEQAVHDVHGRQAQRGDRRAQQPRRNAVSTHSMRVEPYRGKASTRGVRLESGMVCARIKPRGVIHRKQTRASQASHGGARESVS